MNSMGKPEFDTKQKEQTSLILEKKLDASIYAKPEFDDYQIDQINLGLEEKLDVSIYAKPELSW